jgi:hypothetical protein
MTAATLQFLEGPMPHMLLKDDRSPGRIVVEMPDEDRLDAPGGIRCPRCGWRPADDSRWACVWGDGPEPRFQACGTVWNTFATRGRCPGCRHQWRWTSCLECEEWSLHEDWYEEAGA